MVAGGPGSYALFYLDGLSPSEAWSKTVTVSVLSSFAVTQQVPFAQGVLEVSVATLALFVDMYLTGFLRRRILVTEPRLSPLSPGGESAFHRAFGLVSDPRGAILFTVVFLFLYVPSRSSVAGGPYFPIEMSFLTLIASTVYGTAFWVYLSGLWGVYRFGLEPLRLKPFYEDRMLGLRPLGQVVLAYAMTFSGAITVTLGNSLLSGDVGSIVINLVIVGLGVAMLFLPLRGIHRKMVEVKEAEEAALRLRSKEFLNGLKDDGVSNQDTSSKIEELLELQRYQALKVEASMISEWPFETRSVERLIGILLAIFTVVLARLLQVAT